MNRKQQQKKKQILFLVFVALVLISSAVVFAHKYSGMQKEIQYHESYREDTILYDGKEYRYNDHLSNYLFMGIDTPTIQDAGEGFNYAGQADAIFLLSLDRVKMELKCLVIPRDTLTQIESFSPSGKSLGMMESHINLQYAFGDGKEKSCELMKTAVSNMLYGVPIQGYMALSMNGIPTAVDVLGGVEIVVSDDSLEEAYPEFTKGQTVLLTKDNAEAYVRYRNVNISQSAITRTERQKVFLKAFAQKAKADYQKDPSLIGDFYDEMQEYMVTNMSNDLFVKLMEASFDSEENVIILPGKGLDDGRYDVYNIDDGELYALILQLFYVEI